MKCKKLGKQLLLFTFKTQKEITMTFFRMEEYYESPIKGLYQNKFDVFDFLNESMDDNGHIDYFSKWIGFNIPGHSIRDWSELHCPNYTPKEAEVLNHINSKVDTSQPFYIIAAKEGKTDVMDHEIAHALYYLDKGYKTVMNIKVSQFKKQFPVQYLKVQSWLKQMGYNKSVFMDETQAYMSTSDKKEIMSKFGIKVTEYKKMERVILEFRNVLSEYNTFKK
jgi:hypothetical protein